jgi:hypothetical protein
MTASRTCRACGAELAPDVRWCLRCYAPVLEHSPRGGQLPPVHFLAPKDDHRTSRWKGGATTFGPVGRVAITAAVLLFAPWTAAGVVGLVVVWPVFLLVAFVVLRSTWRRGRVDIQPARTTSESTTPAPERIRPEIPRPTIVAWVLLGAAAVGVVVATTLVGPTGKVLLNMAMLLALSVVLIRWLVRP